MTDSLIINYLESVASNKESLFQEVADWQKSQNFIEDDTSIVIEELRYRETVGTTILEEGFALPHVSNKVVKFNNILLVHLNQSISKWDGEYKVDTCLFLFLQPAINQSIKNQVKNIMVMLADSHNIPILRSQNLEKIETLMK